MRRYKIWLRAVAPVIGEALALVSIIATLWLALVVGSAMGW